MRIDTSAAVKKIPPIAASLASKRAINAVRKCPRMRQGAVQQHHLEGLRLALVAVLIFVIAIAPGGRAIAGTLEIPQATPSPLPSSGQAAEPPETASPSNSPGEVGSGSAAEYGAKPAPTSAAQPQPMPQVAGIDQYMNQDGRGGGYPPSTVPDPRNNRSSSSGGLLLGGLMVGFIALEIVINHHR